MAEVTKNSWGTEIERALFEGQLFSIALTHYENERPPHGLCGRLDWHFHGIISRCIREGAITGKVGECIYLPVTRSGSTFHFILAGAGPSPSPGHRAPIPNTTLQILQKNLTALKLPKTGISKSDFGNVTSEFITKHFKGVPLWIAS